LKRDADGASVCRNKRPGGREFTSQPLFEPIS
jgi:hypothetical protein